MDGFFGERVCASTADHYRRSISEVHLGLPPCLSGDFSIYTLDKYSDKDFEYSANIDDTTTTFCVG